MIDLNQLEEGLENRFSDLDSLVRDAGRLQRLLYAIARRHNQTWRELENIKESQGYYKKPFLFLCLPREIRDRIYLYSLQAPITADVRFRLCVDGDNYPYKPPTPGLLRTNKQIYREATEILYSKNVFSFYLPQELLNFEEQIGASHRDLIRQIKIIVLFLPHNVVAEPPERLALEDYDPYPSHWVMALQKSRLEKITRMIVEADFICGSDTETTSMPASLQKSIEEMFSRNQVKPFTPQLVIRQFSWGEEEKFPKDWGITTEPVRKKYLEAIEEEWREWRESEDYKEFNFENFVDAFNED
jgi:hypothetical protein